MAVKAQPSLGNPWPVAKKEEEERGEIQMLGLESTELCDYSCMRGRFRAMERLTGKGGKGPQGLGSPAETLAWG